jgi:murein DD-endopeptidase MepM/ murein hydrolase activator NlpD
MSIGWDLPKGEAAFWAVRKHDVHTGIDLHCPEGTMVVALQAGRVVAVLPFTGPEADSPWWNPTQAVLVEDGEGVWLYGEVSPLVAVGAELSAGDPVGTVVRVLRHDKGRPTSMLHLERYRPGTREPVWWRLGEPQPEPLLDPTPLLFKEGG